MARSDRTTLTTQIGPFIAIPVRVLERCRDAPAIHLYAWLSKYANQDRKAWPGQTRLAKDMGVSLRSMHRALETLKGAGVVTTSQIREGGVVVGTEYVLVALLESVYMPPVARRLPTQDDSTCQNLHATGDTVTRSIEELDPTVRTSKKAKKTRRHLPHIYCGDHFCVEYEKHERFERRMVAAGIDKADVDLKAMYATWDRAFGEAGTTDHPALWLEKQFAAALKAEHGEVA